MKNSNIVKVDSKGRVLIPYHVRELNNINDGSEFVILSTHTGEVRLMPMLKGKCADIKVVHVDDPSTLAKITNIMARHSIGIVMSQSKALERGYLAEWNALIDISRCKNLKKFYNQISRLDAIKNIEMNEK
ncbi:MAG: hypothetical protein HYW25_04235 [Candidatus Aenigmarchaeota archaeon]|nr:hypothetical protein [Candidatus Aenigmarchaeota archaeon]